MTDPTPRTIDPTARRRVRLGLTALAITASATALIAAIGLTSLWSGRVAAWRSGLGHTASRVQLWSEHPDDGWVRSHARIERRRFDEVVHVVERATELGELRVEVRGLLRDGAWTITSAETRWRQPDEDAWHHADVTETLRDLGADERLVVPALRTDRMVFG